MAFIRGSETETDHVSGTGCTCNANLQFEVFKGTLRQIWKSADIIFK